MALQKFTKQPNDVLDYDVDFSDWMVSGDEVDGVTVSADAGVTVDSYAFTDEIVKVWLSGGTDGETYKITVLATTEGGRSKEQEFRIKVKEK